MNNRIRQLRKAKGITMKQLGVIVGVAESTISQYENGKRQPDFATLLKLSNYFSVTIGYILGAEEKNAPVAPKYDEDTEKLIAAILELPPEKKKALADLMGIDCE